MANKRSASSSSRATKPPAKPAAKPAAARASAKGPTPNKRVTPKGTGRYTPPIPKETKVSPVWVPILMFSCLLLGMALIICNYVSVLPKSPNNGWLLGGLGLITVGFVTATKYH